MMKQALLSLSFGMISMYSMAQYLGFNDAQRNELTRQRMDAKVKMKTSFIQEINMSTGEVVSEKVGFVKYNRFGSLTESGLIQDSVEIIGLKQYYNEKNELIRQDSYSDNSPYPTIRFWEYDSLGHVVFQKDSAVNYRAKYLFTTYTLREDSSICGITKGFERMWVKGHVSERIIPGTFILYENNDLRITRGALNAYGEIGDHNSIEEFNENGERVGQWYCSRMMVNQREGNYCSSFTNIYNDEGLITHTESKDARGQQPRDHRQHYFTYNSANQLVEVESKWYSIVERKELFWNADNRVSKIIFKEGKATENYYQLELTYNSKGLIETETFSFLESGIQSGFIKYAYVYFDE